VPGCSEDWFTKHKMSGGNTSECSYHLSDNVRRNMPPFDPMLPSIGSRYSRIEVRSRDRTKRQDQGHEHCTGRKSIGEQGDCDIAT
jgi:hypothetical protein